MDKTNEANDQKVTIIDMYAKGWRPTGYKINRYSIYHRVTPKGQAQSALYCHTDQRLISIENIDNKDDGEEGKPKSPTSIS